MSQKSFEQDLLQFIKSIRFPLYTILILWVVKGLEVFFNYNYVRYGIFPRELDGILGILTGPFVHGSLEHLLSNTFPLLFVGIMIQSFYKRISIVVTILTWLFTGILVWLFARPAYHIGASGVVYGLVGFLLWSGLFRRDTKSITLSLLVLAIYSSYFLGFEKIEGVSWESHLLGAIVGLVFAFLFRNVREPEEVVYHEAITIRTKQKYFHPDTFEKTKYERWLESQMPQKFD
jgi:membrane associated rhomboid family serine protease